MWTLQLHEYHEYPQQHSHVIEPPTVIRLSCSYFLFVPGFIWDVGIHKQNVLIYCSFRTLEIAVFCPRLSHFQHRASSPSNIIMMDLTHTLRNERTYSVLS